MSFLKISQIGNKQPQIAKPRKENKKKKCKREKLSTRAESETTGFNFEACLVKRNEFFFQVL